MAKKKNKFYAFETAEGRGIVSSWAECEARVKGRKARFKGFVERSAAERWLEGGESSGGNRRAGKRKFYAYHLGHEEGIVNTWAECQAVTRGHKARYRGFESREAAQAWLDGGAQYADRKAEKALALSEYPEEAIFFDAGTGAGRGVEIKVTDRDGTPLLHLVDSLRDDVTAEGTVILQRGRTNNYGELLACLRALDIARMRGVSHVFGDSKLVLEYWSLGRVSKAMRETDADLVKLSALCKNARAEFEAGGGTLGHVPGGINPADLGYHRD